MGTDVYEDMLSVILSHKGAAFISAWLASISVQHVSEPSSPGKSGRGRKAGAAPEEQRCMWAHTKAGRCKNSKQDGVDFCKIHVDKAALIGDDVASIVSGLEN
jgi:hypothetical protein